MSGRVEAKAHWLFLGTIQVLGVACSTVSITGSGKVVTIPYSVSPFTR